MNHKFLRALSSLALILAVAGPVWGSYIIPDGSITTAKLASGAVTQAKRAALNDVVSGSSGTWTTTSATFSAVTNLSVSITTTGRPVMIFLQGDTVGAGCYFQMNSSGGGASGFVQMYRNSSIVITAASVTTQSATVNTIPCGTMAYMDQPAAGTYTYSISGKVSSGTGTLTVGAAVLVAYEL